VTQGTPGCLRGCRETYLEDGAVEEEGQQLDEIVVDVAVLLLHPDDVGRVERLVLLLLHLVEGEEAKLEEVLYNDGNLEHKEGNKE